MNSKLIPPYDLGKFFAAESVAKLSIADIVRQIKGNIFIAILKSRVEIAGQKIQLTLSKTNFNGKRFWFLCPLCGSRRGMLYTQEGVIGCRICLGLKYRRQKYKGMIESQYQK